MDNVPIDNSTSHLFLVSRFFASIFDYPNPTEPDSCPNAIQIELLEASIDHSLTRTVANSVQYSRGPLSTLQVEGSVEISNRYAVNCPYTVVQCSRWIANRPGWWTRSAPVYQVRRRLVILLPVVDGPNRKWHLLQWKTWAKSGNVTDWCRAISCSICSDNPPAQWRAWTQNCAVAGWEGERAFLKWLTWPGILWANGPFISNVL